MRLRTALTALLASVALGSNLFALLPAEGANTHLQPTNLTITPGDGKLALTWGVNETNGLGAFKVNWKATTASSWSSTLLPSVARSYTITGLLNGVSEEVQVRALAAAGVTSSSATPTGITEPPKEEEPPPKEEPPTPTGATVNRAPSGPPAPSGGWKVAYGEGFGAALGSIDNTFAPGENKDNGCCGNSNEIAIQRTTQASITSEGLRLTCAHISTPVNGHSYSCGAVRGSTSQSPQLTFNKGATYAIEWRGKLPPNYGFADPGVWQYGTSSSEMDYPEGAGWSSRYAGGATGVGGWKGLFGYFAWFFSPHPEMVYPEVGSWEGAQHAWTTYIHPTTGGKYRYSLFVDGKAQPLAYAPGCYSLSCAQAESPDVTPTADAAHLVVTYGLRAALSSAGKANEASGTGFPNSLTVRSLSVYIDAGHTGTGAVTNEGIAPGTTVAP